VGETPTMPNSSPSKLTLWMEYSSADLDKEWLSIFRRVLLSFAIRIVPGARSTRPRPG
jgi:hypothetical protein